MRVSSKVRYAVLAMCELASHAEEYASVAVLAERQQIPQTFLEQLLLRMKRAGLTISRRGPEGGYALALPADRIRVGDIYVAIAGPLNLCDNQNATDDPISRAEQLLWRELESTVLNFLNGLTLNDLLQRGGDKAQSLPIAHPYTFSI